ncbi:hypothetical protein [Amycolatopsis pigmentata]|uniref:Tyr recombinase domain-containing protein n=1 Tax=Amycolatopsis pigmentata TaxID=450801 RepID=A0ABW5FXN9_9PSEU
MYSKIALCAKVRHGAASLSLAAGNELKTVQAMLGHSGIVLTADTYTTTAGKTRRYTLPEPGRIHAMFVTSCHSLFTVAHRQTGSTFFVNS